MTWHPPIPNGLATDPAVRELKYKMALHLLLYCYDDVRRDGSVKISLKEAATALQEPYETVRRWWRSLLDGPFFAKQRDCGRNGWDVQFAPEWIDWHVLSNNFQRSPMNVETKPEAPSIDTERSPMNGQELNITVSSTSERSPMNAENPAYKEDQHDQNPERVGSNSKQAPPHSPFVLAYFSTYPNETLSADQIAEINQRVTDLKRWKQALRYWSTNSHRARSIGKICDRYDEEAVGRNGHERGPPIPTQAWKPPDDALSGAALQEAIAARTKKRE